MRTLLIKNKSLLNVYTRAHVNRGELGTEMQTLREAHRLLWDWVTEILPRFLKAAQSICTWQEARAHAAASSRESTRWTRCEALGQPPTGSVLLSPVITVRSRRSVLG